MTAQCYPAQPKPSERSIVSLAMAPISSMNQFKEHEKVLAATVNVSAIFVPYLGPIIGIIVGAKSPYVKYHAYRNLIEEIMSFLVITFLIICSLSYTIYSLYHSQRDGFDLAKIDWVTIIFKAVLTWLLLGLWTVVNTLLSIRDAIQALSGKLPAKPKWSERKAMSLSGLS